MPPNSQVTDLSASRHRIPELDAVRALMAWWVVLVHTCEFCGIHRTPFINILWSVQAVNVFIILSGFVIFLLLDTTKESYGTFIFRRLARLYPVYLVVLLAALASLDVTTENVATVSSLEGWRAGIQQSTTQFLPAHILAHLSMFHGVIPERILPFSSLAIVPPAWSLSLEWQFYLVAPLVFIWVRKKSWGWIALSGVVGIHLISTNFHMPRFATASFLPLNLGYFLLGICSYDCFKRLSSPEARRPCLVLLYPCILTIALLFLIERQLAVAVWVILFTPILLMRFSTTPLDSASRFAVKILNISWLKYLGKISFTTYLVHEVTLHWGLNLLLRQGLVTPTSVSFAALAGLACPLTLLVSILLHHTVELPCIAAARRWAARPTVPISRAISDEPSRPA